MARYTEANCRKCRAVGEKLFLKAKKCYTAKCILERRPNRPGQHGKYRRKISEYSIQLSEKQKLRNMYGMLERQFRLYFSQAARMKGVTGDNLLQLLERRLDNVVMEAGLAGSRKASRQLVRHGHIRVNGSRVDIPSYHVGVGDKIEVADREKSNKLAKAGVDISSSRVVPAWLTSDQDKLVVDVVSEPNVEDLKQLINVQLIVELYSK